MKCCPLNLSMNSAAFLSFSQMKHHWTLNVCCLLSPVTAWAARTSLRRLLFTWCLSKLTPSFLFRCLFLVSLFSFYHFSFLPLCLCFFWLLWCYLSNYNSVWNSVFEEISDYTQEFICFIDRKLKRSINSWFWHLIIFAIPAFTKKKTGNPQLTQQNPECADVLFVSHLEYEVGVSRNTLGQTTAPTKMCIHS